MWSFLLKGRSLEGAHNSLVDAHAKSDLVLHQQFIPYLDRTDSLSPIDRIYGVNKLSELKKEMEPSCPLHEPWTELTTESEIKWRPTGDDNNNGSAGGSIFGPTSVMIRQA
jgi:hypothetical protein